MENQGRQVTSEGEGQGEAKRKEAGAAVRNHHAPTQPSVPLIISLKGLAGTEHNVWQKQGEGQED